MILRTSLSYSGTIDWASYVDYSRCSGVARYWNYSRPQLNPIKLDIVFFYWDEDNKEVLDRIHKYLKELIIVPFKTLYSIQKLKFNTQALRPRGVTF